jgi:putative endonuclease
MIWVYLMQSSAAPARRYIGHTSDLERRIEQHNLGLSPPTAAHRPWELIVAVLFRDLGSGVAFEKYLKSRSGKAFADAWFWTDAAR